MNIVGYDIMTVNRRTKFEICKNIFDVLFLAKTPPISFTEIRKKTGLGAESVRTWIYLIKYIQAQPNLVITERGRKSVVDLEREDISLSDISRVDMGKWIAVMHKMLTMPEHQLQKRVKALRETLKISSLSMGNEST